MTVASVAGCSLAPFGFALAQLSFPDALGFSSTDFKDPDGFSLGFVVSFWDGWLIEGVGVCSFAGTVVLDIVGFFDTSVNIPS